MGSVGRAESVVDIRLSAGVFGELFGEFGVVFILLGVEAGIFEQNDISGFHGRASFLNLRADAIVNKYDRLAEFFREGLGDGREGELFIFLALRASEVACQNKHGAFVYKVFYRRQSRNDAGVVANFPFVVEGDVEVYAHKDFFAFEIHVFYRLYL